MALSARKMWGIAAIVTGAVFIAAGIIAFVAPITPLWVPIALLIIESIGAALGINLLAKPEIPA